MFPYGFQSHDRNTAFVYQNRDTWSWFVPKFSLQRRDHFKARFPFDSVSPMSRLLNSKLVPVSNKIQVETGS